ncbi:MAG: hypothetical protein KIT80_05725 [Chitinophagaceae bacterium]|nr:hypothetical protein [Chitinophagaceae bacterium]MCW5926396.1 hypothetical protein [Chitinophagaceae bacterium]
MRRYFVCLLMLQAAYLTVSGQKKFRPYRIMFKPGVGYDLPLNTVSVNEITDQLTDMNGRGIAFQMFSIGIYPRERLGFELMFRGLSERSAGKRNDAYNRLMQERWGAAYFYDPVTPYEDYGAPFESNRFTVGLSVNYKFDRGRIIYIPKYFFGVVEIGQSRRFHTMKQRNSNNMLLVEYDTEKYYRDLFITGPAASVVYRLNQTFGVSLDASLFWHRARASFRERHTDLFTRQHVETPYNYSGTMFRGNIGLGLVVGMSKRRR